jgi:hypothetical protein
MLTESYERLIMLKSVLAGTLKEFIPSRRCVIPCPGRMIKELGLKLGERIRGSFCGVDWGKRGGKQ